MKLVSHNLGGNIHDAVRWVNEFDLADRVIHFESVSAHGTIVVFRLPDAFDFERHIKIIREIVK